MRLTDLGGDHLEDPFAQDPQRFGVVDRGVPQQRRLRLGNDLGVQVVGQRLDRTDDHLGLIHQQAAISQRDPDRLVRQPSPTRQQAG